MATSDPGLDPIENVTTAIEQFVSVASNDLGAAVSLAIGFLILGVVGIAVAYLGIGAIIDLVRPEPSGK